MDKVNRLERFTSLQLIKSHKLPIFLLMSNIAVIKCCFVNSFDSSLPCIY
uniref:Uncharacterized protein n=1 Tax=Octopus bimaculoides TaxID=37653 RepID=A0A0L8FKC1_OCTBM